MGPQPRRLGGSTGPTHQRCSRRLDTLPERVPEPVPRHTSRRTSTSSDRKYEDEVARRRPIHPRLREGRPEGRIPAHGTRNCQILLERTDQIHRQRHSQAPESQHLRRNQTTSDRQCSIPTSHLRDVQAGQEHHKPTTVITMESVRAAQPYQPTT
jgi:hypothetical protein